MTALRPMLMDEVYLRPSPDGMAFCEYAEGFCETQLEIDISGETQDEWDVTAIRMLTFDIIRTEHSGGISRPRYEELSGAFFDSTRAWLLEHRRERLEEYVEHEWLPAEIGAYQDHKRAESY